MRTARTSTARTLSLKGEGEAGQRQHPGGPHGEFCLFKGDALYLSKGMEKAEKLVSGVEDVMSVDLEKGHFSIPPRESERRSWPITL